MYARLAAVAGPQTPSSSNHRFYLFSSHPLNNIHASPKQPASSRALLRVGNHMTFSAQADANRRAESITSSEIGFVPSNATAGIQVENPDRGVYHPKLASFRQMPLQADPQLP